MFKELLHLFDGVQGQYLSSIDSEGAISSKRKDYSRAVIDRYLGQKLGQDPAKYFEGIGLGFKTTPIHVGNLISVEPLRLASLNLLKLVEESWVKTELSKVLQGILILPLNVEAKNLGQSYRRVSKPLVWIPSDQEIAGIRDEWYMFQNLAQRGAVPNIRGVSSTRLTYPTEAMTKFIHMKPHSTKGKFEQDAFGNQVRKMAFYLNTAKLRELILQSHSI